MYSLSFYVPVEYAEQVKEALFAAGAGRQGDYDKCSWQTLGQGQFRPLAGSSPFIGVQGALEYVDEYKVEMICAEENIVAAVAALKAAHPYEEPAYSVIKIEVV